MIFSNYSGLLFSLTFRRFINYLRVHFGYFLSNLFKKVIVFGQPYSLTIEPTNVCNLHCIQCPTGMGQLTRPKMNINLKKFQEIIDYSYKDLIYLMLYFQGEPFLHPQFPEMVQYAKSKRIYTMTSTNGHFLSEENCEKIINSGLDRILISLDGTSPETYEKYRKGGSFNLVMEGIGRLIKLRKKLNFSTPKIILQFIVFAHNEHEISEIKALAKKWNVSLELKTAQIYNPDTNKELIPANKKYSRYFKNANGIFILKKQSRSACKRMWTTQVITANGALVPCCYDKNADYAIEMENKNPSEIWKSDSYQQLRRKVLRSKELTICKDCPE